MATIRSFHWADYLLFVLTLVISALIGIFYAWRERKLPKYIRSTSDFLLAGRNMPIVPVALSLLASFLSAILILGVPANTFYTDTSYWLISFSNILTFPVVAHAFLPVFRKIPLTSAYEYLELRFNMAVRVLGCLLFQLQMLFYMAVVLYAPALALSQVMNISSLVSILVVGLVCTFYTSIGGLKAVMWTDAFQMVIVFGGMLAVIIKGTQEVGGWDSVWKVAGQGNKLRINNFDPDPFQAYTFWTCVIGGFMTSLTIYASNQTMIQRYLSMSTTKKAQIALYLNVIPAVVFTSLLVYLGLVAYARYHDEDPIANCRVNKRDQIIPLLVMDILGSYPGLPGLFVSCLFSASLSTVSSGVNALAAVCLTDLIKPLYRVIKKEPLKETKASIISKILAVLYGLATIGLAFLSGILGNLILQISLSIFGIFGGPLLGVFVLALFVPCANTAGALAGLIASTSVSFWIAIGSTLQTMAVPSPSPVCSDNGSIGQNTTLTSMLTGSLTMAVTESTDIYNVTTSTIKPLEGGLFQFYRLSFMWYSTLAVLVACIVGILVSCLTGGTRGKPVEERLLSPLYNALAPCCSVISTPDYKELDDEKQDDQDVFNQEMTVVPSAISSAKL